MTMFPASFSAYSRYLTKALFLVLAGAWLSAQAAIQVPAPASDEKPSASHSETMVLAGGCFWGVQGVFQHVKGVSNAVSGYAGGKADAATYKQVSRGDTGHAEAVKITYDPAQVTYGQLLQIYFTVAHDPTELNRQGPDRGTQYRSALFPVNDAQRAIAQSYIAQLNKAKVFDRPIATKVEAYEGFYPAEAYHQNYLTLNPDYPYIVINDLPKVASLEKQFPRLYRSQAVLVETR